jgi:hypothetical protein
MAIKTAIAAHKRPPITAPAPTRQAPAPSQAYKPKPEDLIQQIANYYAGKPINISYDNSAAGLGYNGSAVAGSDAIKLSPEVKQSLDFLLKNYGSNAGATKGVPGLGTLIHESLHTRGPVGTPHTLDPATGFYNWDDEWQARQLSYGLIADAMQRFFGVKNSTPLGQRYYQTAEGYGYTDPVKNPFGGPETPEEIAQWGERARPTSNPWGWYFPWATPPPSAP